MRWLGKVLSLLKVLSLFFVWDLTFTVVYLTVYLTMGLTHKGKGSYNKRQRDTRAEKIIIPTQKRGGESHNSDPCPSPFDEDEWELACCIHYKTFLDICYELSKKKEGGDR